MAETAKILNPEPESRIAGLRGRLLARGFLPAEAF
jgi:hypothetical protein